MKKISTSTLQRPMVICLLAAFCCLLWGSAFPAVKIGYGLLSISSADSAEQLIFAGLRFFFAGVVAVLFHSASLRRLRLPARSSLWKATKLGLIQTLVQYALFYIGMAHTSGVKGSVLMAVHVFFAILISAKLFHYERLNAPKLLGCLCGFGGVLLINLSGGGLGGGFTLLGDGAVLLAALASLICLLCLSAGEGCVPTWQEKIYLEVYLLGAGAVDILLTAAAGMACQAAAMGEIWSERAEMQWQADLPPSPGPCCVQRCCCARWRCACTRAPWAGPACSAGAGAQCIGAWGSWSASCP